MTFGVAAINGAVDARSGQVDYRLARRHLINEHKRGRLGRRDVCDAHPELMRAAVEVGTPIPEPCPICEESTLVSLTYVFGGRLPAFHAPAHCRSYARLPPEPHHSRFPS